MDGGARDERNPDGEDPGVDPLFDRNPEKSYKFEITWIKIQTDVRAGKHKYKYSTGSL